MKDKDECILFQYYYFLFFVNMMNTRIHKPSASSQVEIQN